MLCVKVKTLICAFRSFQRLFFHFSKRQYSCNVTVNIGYRCPSPVFKVFNTNCINGLQQHKVRVTLCITFFFVHPQKQEHSIQLRIFLRWWLVDYFLTVILVGTKTFPYIMWWILCNTKQELLACCISLSIEVLLISHCQRRGAGQQILHKITMWFHAATLCLVGISLAGVSCFAFKVLLLEYVSCVKLSFQCRFEVQLYWINIAEIWLDFSHSPGYSLYSTSHHWLSWYFFKRFFVHTSSNVKLSKHFTLFVRFTFNQLLGSPQPPWARVGCLCSPLSFSSTSECYFEVVLMQIEWFQYLILSPLLCDPFALISSLLTWSCPYWYFKL